MVSAYEDIVRGNKHGGYFESIKKSYEFDSAYTKCRGCSRMSPDCPKAECFGGKKAKKGKTKR